ncbi:TBC1 domain family member 1-like isoform X2 [Ptychodera flava]|uniref:TBC1 domain family member 1-like isoform X2 n=1 Tax=Ptychodera flava TaxID=63121 RepID=UPI00396A7848
MSLETNLPSATATASKDMTEQINTKNKSGDVDVHMSENEIDAISSTLSARSDATVAENFEAGEKMTFNLMYYGVESLDRRFTQSMLPWILAEVRRRLQTRRIIIQLSAKSLLCIDEETGSILFEHRLQGISRISRCQRVKTCFAYLYRINADSDFSCHVFQAAESDMVHKFAKSVREAAREATKCDQHAKDHGKLPVTECLIDGNSSNFEVLYVGKIVVSHKKAPPTLIDDTIQKFREHEERKREKAEENEEKADDVINEKEAEETNTETNDNTTNVKEKDSKAVDEKENTDSNTKKELTRRKSKTNELRSENRSKRNVHSTESEKNRIILFHIGRNDISLISLDKKNFMLTKRFKEISFCSQGIKLPEYFGFICREKTANSSYMCYAFKCQSGAVVDEILLTLRQAFHSALQTSHVICETCPMHQLHKLCLELEGQSVSKVHKLLSKRLENLSDSQHAEVVAMLKENSLNEQEENDIIMAFLRSVCEAKQKTHVHISDNGSQRESPKLCAASEGTKPMSKFDAFKNKAKKSLTSSFDNLLGRNRSGSDVRSDSSVMNSGFRSRSNTFDKDDSPYKLALELGESPVSAPPTPNKLQKANSQDMGTEDHGKYGNGPLPEIRKRSSTIGEIPMSPKSPLSPASLKNFNFTPPKLEDKGNSTPASRILRRQMSEMPTPASSSLYNSPRKGSWRQAIFNRVVTPLRNNEPKRSIVRESSKEVDDVGSEGSGSSEPSPATQRKTPKVKSRFKSKAAIRALWKKAIMEQILLLRMEKENKTLQGYFVFYYAYSVVTFQARQDAATTKREKLDYEEITPCLKEITGVWEEMMQAGINFDYQKLLKSVKAGVPRMKRGEIWKFLMHQHAVANKAVFEPPPDTYEELLKQLTSHQHAILIDLGRTFPTHPYFATQLGPGQLSLFNLLKAYSLLDQEVGYCQGLSFVAGILLMHMKEDVAFEVLKYMMFQLGIRGQYKPDMVFLQLQMYQLSRLLHDYYRPLHDHLEQHDIAPSLYAAPWFLTIFASQFPLGFVARVFDLVFLQGMEVVTKVALIILGSHSELILQCDSFEGIVDFLKNTLPSLGIIQMERTINQVFELDISQQLHAYEVEYQVLQEEMINSPFRGDSDQVEKLEAGNRDLKRQNKELTEQLQKANENLHSMEATYSSMQAALNKYKSQVRALELERTALLNTVTQLRKLVPEDKLQDTGINPGGGGVSFTLGEVKETQISTAEASNNSEDSTLVKSNTNSSFEDDLDLEVACYTRVHELKMRGRHFSGESITSTCSEVSSSSTSDFVMRPESNQS